MIDVSFSVRARLAAPPSIGLANVGTLADMEAMKAVPRVLPAAYVAPLSERADPGVVKQASVQMHVAAFGVALMVTHAGDATGARAADALTPLREAVHARLVGWIPPGCHTPVQFIEGSLLATESGTTVWQDVFTVQRRVQRQQT